MGITSRHGLAVVTGGAGGLGSSFANRLAERGYHLLLVDRREAHLERVCEAITARHGVAAEPYALDLCNREHVKTLANRLEKMEDLELLVNNAGFGTIGYFVDINPNHLVGMADVHVVAPTILTRAILPGMIERNHGAIINVSSLSAWLPIAGNAQYASTKSYLAVFSMALQEELRGTNVRVQALCPGFIRTDFHEAETMQGFNLRDAPAHLWMHADDVVNCSLRCLSGRQVLVVPGFGYRLLGRFARMPMFQPLVQRFTWGPRPVPSKARHDEPCSQLNLGVAEETTAAS